MGMQRLDLGGEFYLSPIQASDKAAYLEHFADPEIGRMLLAVPVPYTEADADRWIAHRLKNALKHEIQFGIRVADGSLIGGIGLVEERSAAIYRGEIGYWLAREYRGRGLMPRAIRVFADYAFRKLQLHKLTATTYPFNPSSSRALEKAGFTFEGRMREHVRSRKGDEYFDSLVYGLVSSDWTNQPLER
jgi:[ribosomal protein S5]-alanine N-acetyltransferase